MIIVKLYGGLGNQMFQYAAGRSLAKRNNSELKIDISWFNSSEKNRKYDLSLFDIREHFSTANDYNEFRIKEASRFNRWARKLLPALAYEFVNETNFGFDEQITNRRGNFFLDGYWQSEKYFLRYEDVIRREFTVKKEPEGLNLSLCKDMKSNSSTSLHVRRGDYVSNPSFNKVHGVLPLGYYENAIALMAS